MIIKILIIDKEKNKMDMFTNDLETKKRRNKNFRNYR